MDELVTDLETRRAAWTTNPTAANHEAYLDSARAILEHARGPSVPVDVDDCAELFRRNYSVAEIQYVQPHLNNGRLATYEGLWNEEVSKQAARARQAVALALSVLKAVA
jgi:hypothetical protein